MTPRVELEEAGEQEREWLVATPHEAERSTRNSGRGPVPAPRVATPLASRSQDAQVPGGRRWCLVRSLSGYDAGTSTRSDI